MVRRTLAALVALAFAGVSLPAAASAETHTFLNNTDLFADDGGSGIFGPANEYPSSIVVSGVSGTVTKATVTVIDLGSGNADDIDMAITGPNGQAVMLMSDACGTLLSDNDWTFDDAAATFLSDNGPCSSGQDASFRPSNYGDPSQDDLSPDGGPAGPYLNSLSLLAGGSANGSWDLFVRDDDPTVFGFSINAWSLSLEVQPPATPPGTQNPPTTSAPGPAKKKCKKKGKKAAVSKKCKKKRK